MIVFMSMQSLSFSMIYFSLRSEIGQHFDLKETEREREKGLCIGMA